jgi:hypothetical protein
MYNTAEGKIRKPLYYDLLVQTKKKVIQNTLLFLHHQ